MIGKPGSGAFPFACSQIALLVVGLAIASRPACAEQNEAPAVLHFAQQYQQQKLDTPHYIPRKNTDIRHRPSPENRPPSPPPVRQEAKQDTLTILRKSISQREGEIRAQTQTIQALEKQLTALKTTGQKTASVEDALSPRDRQSVQNMLESLKRTFSLQPGADALTEQLKQANEQAARARQSEAAMLKQQATLNQTISALRLQLRNLKREQTTLSSKEADNPSHQADALASRVQILNAEKQQLAADLAENKAEMSRAVTNVQQLESRIRALEGEKKRYADENENLMLQIANHSQTSEALEAAKRQQQKLQSDLLSSEKHSATAADQVIALQEKLTAAQQQRDSVRAEKDALQKQLAASPTAQQLADSQLNVKTLQSQLDSALLVQKKEQHDSDANDAVITAERKAAEAKIHALQSQLDDALQQQTAGEKMRAGIAQLSREKQAAEETIGALKKQLGAAQLQQSVLEKEKLRDQTQRESDLQAKQERVTVLTAQLKTLQEKLTAVQRQQHGVQTEKEALQKQLATSPTAKQLADSQLNVKALQAQLDSALLAQKKAQRDEDVDNTTRIAERKAADEKISALQSQLETSRAALSKMQQQSAGPAVKGIAEITAEKLKKNATREAYAIGISLGEEILQLQAENRSWTSTESDRPSVLAGIVDAFQGHARLPPEELKKTLTGVFKKIQSGHAKLVGELDQSTRKYLARFTGQKGAKKSDSGFWYRVGYAGDTPVPHDAVIDVVVKESLTNGVVIEDMDAKGIVLTNPVSAFPPIFREALSKLKNHGSITIVVPPNLAYGDKGYPPKVPPNATMIYDIRISEVYPGTKDKDKKKENK